MSLKAGLRAVGLTGALHCWEQVLQLKQGTWHLRGQTAFPASSSRLDSRGYEDIEQAVVCANAPPVPHSSSSALQIVCRKGSCVFTRSKALVSFCLRDDCWCPCFALHASRLVRQRWHVAAVTGRDDDPDRYCWPSG